MKEFTDDTSLITEIQELVSSGIPRENLYVLSHDDNRTNRVAENANANQIGIEEEGLATAVGNIFRRKGDELREKLKQFGYTQEESAELENKLDAGKILLFVNND